MHLNAAPKELGLAPIASIVSNLDRVFGVGVWQNYEIETISLEFGMVFDDLTKDKLNFLQILTQQPELFFIDVLFFLHGVNVINNNASDFQTLPFPNSLEIALAYSEMNKLYSDKEYGPDVQKTVRYILTLEGYSEPVSPFDKMGVKSDDLVKGQTEQDTKNKALAIKQYIEGFENAHRDPS